MRHHIKYLSLYHFKNYDEASFEFHARIVCVSGSNGTGKTSILDAIHTLCFTKSYFVHIDSALVKYGEMGMRIKGIMQSEPAGEIVNVLRENGKKEVSMNGELYAQFSKHIGKYTCIMIAPDDTQLITEGAEARRKFLDVLISQIDEFYMQQLIVYNKSLAQRNAYLKQVAGNLNEINQSLLEIYNHQLADAGTYIFTKRNEFIEMLKVKTSSIYNYLSEAKELIQMSYVSSLLKNDLLQDLNSNLHKDVFSMRTNYGIHKDDIQFILNEMPFKQVASQGQRKSFLFGLKLAQFEMIQEAKGIYPILLLDDVFEKLDENRSRKLIEYVTKHEAQVFITDTHNKRLHDSFDGLAYDVQYIELT